jgi:hypothetical protein
LQRETNALESWASEDDDQAPQAKPSEHAESGGHQIIGRAFEK